MDSRGWKEEDRRFNIGCPYDNDSGVQTGGDGNDDHSHHELPEIKSIL